MFAKYGINGIWNEDKHKEVIAKAEELGLKDQVEMLKSMNTFDPNVRPLHHRRMSNNSVAFEKKPKKKYLNLVYTMMSAEGEPGFINLEEAKRRRPNAEGINPCAEILLDSYSVCNLTTVNMTQFIDENGKLMEDDLIEAQSLSAQAGLNMTLADLELPHWDRIQKRDRLLGTSVTGFKDAMFMLNANDKEEERIISIMGDTARGHADELSKKYRVNSPLLVTTVKPEGTISQLAGGVSSGLHMNHAPHYFRRVRINSTDPLAKAVDSLGWTIHAEVGTEGIIEEDKLATEEMKEKARTLVITFPISSGAKKSKDDVDVKYQFDTYFRFQNHYTEHNSSNTISINPQNNEWAKAEDIIYKNWDNFVGVSFLESDGGSYTLAPYKTVTEEEVNELKKTMKEFTPEVLERFETGEDSDLEGADGCEGGACPIR